MLPPLLRVLDACAMTGSEAQRKLLLSNATLLAYCMRWQEFRVRWPVYFILNCKSDRIN